MAPLTNAERQKRYRKRLQEKASGAALPEQARSAIAEAAAICWELGVQENIADWDGIATTPDEALDYMRDPRTVKSEGPPCEQLREWFARSAEDASGAHRATIQRAIDLIDAVNLR